MYKNKNKMKKVLYKKFEIFCKNHPPTRHIKYKVIEFASSNKSFASNIKSIIAISFLQPIWNDL